MSAGGRPRLLDLFCGAGGSAVGYHRAGFEVVGVDIAPQPHYPFEFIQADALDVLSEWHFNAFDVIHSSPPCQAHTAMKVMWNAGNHPDLVAQTRRLLQSTGLPYIIENVPGAPLVNPVTVCGASLALRTGPYDLARHRLFETSFPIFVPPCAHGSRPIIGIYGDHARDRRRVPGEANPDRGRQFPANEALALARDVMDMHWANWRELSQAVPPAYTELVGHQLISHLKASAAA